MRVADYSVPIRANLMGNRFIWTRLKNLEKIGAEIFRHKLCILVG